jgi:hypothetical protein
VSSTLAVFYEKVKKICFLWEREKVTGKRLGRHCEGGSNFELGPKQSRAGISGLRRRCAPRNDGGRSLLASPHSPHNTLIHNPR